MPPKNQIGVGLLGFLTNPVSSRSSKSPPLLTRGGCGLSSLREETANGPASADSRVMAKQAHSTEKLHYMQFMVLYMKRHSGEKSNK